MKHAHEIYLEYRLNEIQQEIEQAQRQPVVSIAHVGALKRRRLHIADELATLHETATIGYSPLGGAKAFGSRSIVWI